MGRSPRITTQELVDRENVHEGLVVGHVNAGFVFRKIVVALDLHLQVVQVEVGSVNCQMGKVQRNLREKSMASARISIEPAHSGKLGVVDILNLWCSWLHLAFLPNYGRGSELHLDVGKPTKDKILPSIQKLCRFPIGKTTEKKKTAAPSKPRPIKYH